MVLALLQLIGKRVARVERVEDYYSVYFKDGSILHVYNFLDDICGFDLAGEAVVSVTDNQNVMEIATQSGKKIRISLRNEDYSGAEAFGFKDAVSDRSTFF